MRLSKNVKPISYLKAHASEIIRDISAERTAYVITHNGEAKAIIQDLETYEEMQESLAMLKIVAQGAQERKRGDFTSSKNAFSSLRKRIKNKA